MSTVADFNRIEDCDKIDPLCIDGFSEVTLDEDGTLCVETSWGKQCVDIAEAVKAHESCTAMYLSPEDGPNCLVYEKEENCGDNDCIHGDALSKIISMQKLKDVSQDTPIADGGVYVYNGETRQFEPYDLATALGNLSTALQNINATITNLTSRVTALEAKLTPPAGSPEDARVLFGNINIYSDYNAVIDSNGVATSLDKTHGVYGHALATDDDYDELMG